MMKVALVGSAIASPVLLATLPVPHDWPAWVQLALALLVAVLGPAVTLLTTRGLRAIAKIARASAVRRRALAKAALEDDNPANDPGALRELWRAELEDAAAEALEDPGRARGLLEAAHRDATGRNARGR